MLTKVFSIQFIVRVGANFNEKLPFLMVKEKGLGKNQIVMSVDDGTRSMTPNAFALVSSVLKLLR